MKNPVIFRKTVGNAEYVAINGKNIIALHTSAFIDAARYVYKKLGFKKNKINKAYIGQKVLVLSVEITSIKKN